MSSKKLERQLNLIAALMEGPRALRAEEIHRRVEGYPESGEAFHRAFERDKDDLRAMGLPILMEDLPGADVWLDPSSTLLAEFTVPGLPATLFFDASGALHHIHMGEISRAALLSRMDEIRPGGSP